MRRPARPGPRALVIFGLVVAVAATTSVVVVRRTEEQPPALSVVGSGVAAEPSRPVTAPGETHIIGHEPERDRDGPVLEGRERVPGELLVSFDPGLSIERVDRVLSDLGMERLERLGRGRFIVSIGAGDLKTASRSLSKSPGVLYAEPDFIYEATGLPNDEYMARLWGLHNTGQSVGGSAGTPDADIDADEAWDISTGSPAVTVAVVDSGVAYDHPDLSGRIWTNPGESGEGRESNGRDDDGNGYIDDRHGWDWVDDDADPRDLNSHGTHVAGTIGAQGNNGIGITGVSQNVSIVPLRALGADGSGRTSDIAAAFDYAGRNGVDVVNASLGGPGFSQTLLDSIGRWPDTLFVVAAGNESVNVDLTPTYPCTYPAANLICVAATTSRDELASFSNYGAAQVDIGAPGRTIVSAVPAFAHPFQDGFESSFEETWTVTGSFTRLQDPYGHYVSDGMTTLLPNLDMSLTQLNTVSSASLVGCHLSYAANVDLRGPSDRLIVEAAAPGGTWTTLDAWKGSTQGSWTVLSSSLARFEGSDVKVRFRLVTGGSALGNGVDLDDIDIGCASTAYGSSSYGYMSGTSMATPHVAGAAALLLGVQPDLDPVTAIQILMSSADPLSALFGKTVSGARLNIGAALELVAGPVGRIEDVVTSPSAGASPSDGPAPSPSPAATLPSSDPSPSPSSTPGSEWSPTPGPTPSPTPSEGGEGDDAYDHERTVKARAKRHLKIVGRIEVASGFGPCAADVAVRVLRKGKVVARDRTDDDGRFHMPLPDRPGRYKVVAVPQERPPGTQRCLAATRILPHPH